MTETGAVLDTAPLVAYMAGDTRRFGRAARRALTAAERGRIRLVVPTVCLFEVCLLEEAGRVTLGTGFEAWCDVIDRAPGVTVLPLARSHVVEGRALPALRDPFDRLIAGAAVALGVPLITRDERIAASGRVRVLW